MAVIVDQALVAERLGADDEARRAIGAQAGEGADHALGRDVDRRQAAARRAVRAIVVAQPGSSSVEAAEPRKARRSMPHRNLFVIPAKAGISGLRLP